MRRTVTFVLSKMDADIADQDSKSERETSPALPPELVDMVIDCLAGDLRTLRTCALVARSWLPRTRIYTHRVVALNSRRQCALAAEVYMDAALARCVREVRLTNGAPPDERARAWNGAGRREASDGGGGGDWLDAVAPVIARLRGVPLERAGFEHVKLHEINDRGPDEIVGFPTVTAVALKAFECDRLVDFEAWLQKFPRLEEMTVDSLAMDAPASPSGEGYRPNLRSLNIRSGEGQQFLINWYLTQPRERIKLRQLAYVIEPFRFLVPREQLNALGATVRDVTVIFQYHTPHPMLRAEPLLAALSSIESLTVEFATEYGALYGTSSLCNLLRFVTSTRVRTLTLRFTMETGPEGLFRAHLSGADHLLATLPQFERLAAVVIEVHAAPFARLHRVHRADAWVAEALAHTQELLRDRGEPEPDAGSLQMLERMNLQSTRACNAREEYDRTKVAWERVLATMKAALPGVEARGMLRFRTVDAPSTSRRWRFYDFADQV